MKKIYFLFLVVVNVLSTAEESSGWFFYHNNPFSPLRIEKVDSHLYVYNVNGSQPIHAESCPCKFN